MDWKGRKWGGEPTGEDKAAPNSGQEAEYAPGSGGGRAAGGEGLGETRVWEVESGMGEGSPRALQEAAFEEGKMSLLLPPGLDLVRGCGLLLDFLSDH